uniref:Uncharacterized protein n=1 Tax=Setaria italica TaxID=4555 RepID=K3YNX7_SETIT
MTSPGNPIIFTKSIRLVFSVCPGQRFRFSDPSGTACCLFIAPVSVLV